LKEKNPFVCRSLRSRKKRNLLSRGRGTSLEEIETTKRGISSKKERTKRDIKEVFWGKEGSAITEGLSGKAAPS